MVRQFTQHQWDDRLSADWAALTALALAEDFGTQGDITSRSLVPEQARGRAAVVSRRSGVICGLRGAAELVRAVDSRLSLTLAASDGDEVAAGKAVAELSGPVRAILGVERTMLNLLGRLSGIATLTRAYVSAVAGSRAKIFDTRKTTPGWRRLEKYAVRCGGGWNHRTGLFDAILIKDNHLAFHRQWLESDCGRGYDASENRPEEQPDRGRYSPAMAVRAARQWAAEAGLGDVVVEIEVDTLDQLAEVLPALPDIVLLDNMPAETLAAAVAMRNRLAAEVELEASGGMTLERAAQAAAAGVDRISVGALTHSAVALDLGLDWIDS